MTGKTSEKRQEKGIETKIVPVEELNEGDLVGVISVGIRTVVDFGIIQDIEENDNREDRYTVTDIFDDHWEKELREEFLFKVGEVDLSKWERRDEFADAIAQAVTDQMNSLDRYR